MSAKLKFFLVLILSIFATAVVAEVYKIKQRYFSKSSSLKKQQPIEAKEISSYKFIVDKSKSKYKSIPLTKFKSILKGSDPAALAINALDTAQLKQKTREVEVTYPQPNRAMVTITQTELIESKPTPIKYRVELTSFGRSLFATSPPLWRIVWAGYSEQCLPETICR